LVLEFCTEIITNHRDKTQIRVLKKHGLYLEVNRSGGENQKRERITKAYILWIQMLLCLNKCNIDSVKKEAKSLMRFHALRLQVIQSKLKLKNTMTSTDTDAGKTFKAHKFQQQVKRSTL
jgi:hypothetical protein